MSNELGSPLDIFNKPALSEAEQKKKDLIVTAISNYKKSIDTTDKKFQREAKDKLTNAFWELVNYIVLTKAALGMPTLNFTLAEELLLNFGFLDKSMLPANARIIDTIIAENKRIALIGPFRMYRFTDWLVERYHILFNKPGGPMRGKVLFQTESAKLKVALDKLKKERLEIVKKIQQKSDELKGLRNFVMEYDDFLRNVFKITLKPKLTVADENELKKTADERKKFVQSYETYQKKIEALDEDLAEEYKHIQHKIKTTLSDLIEVDIEAGIYVNIETRALMQGALKKAALPPLSQLEEELREFRSNSSGAAKKARADTCPVILSEKQIITKAEAVDLINRVRMVDTEAFKTSLAKRTGKPGIIFVPGTGDGMFHYENNVFIVPLTPPKTATHSILSSVVQYRWENDEDRTLRDSYQQLKPYKNLNILELRKALLNDYVLWVTKEALGYRVLDKLVRPWFEYTIKINKESVEELKAALSPKKKKKKTADEKELERQKKEEAERKQQQQMLKLKQQKEMRINKAKKILSDVIAKKFPDKPDIAKKVVITGNGAKGVNVSLHDIEYIDFGDLLKIIYRLYDKGYLDDIFRFE